MFLAGFAHLLDTNIDLGAAGFVFGRVVLPQCTLTTMGLYYCGNCTLTLSMNVCG